MDVTDSDVEQETEKEPPVTVIPMETLVPDETVEGFYPVLL